MEIVTPDINNRMYTDNGEIIHFKKIPIGVWNMVASASVMIAHGIGAKYKNIISIDCFIRDDAQTTYKKLSGLNWGPEGTQFAGAIGEISNTTIGLAINPLSAWHSIDYDGDAISRGDILICYHE